MISTDIQWILTIYSLLVASTIDNISIVAMVIRMDPATPETTQLTCLMNLICCDWSMNVSIFPIKTHIVEVPRTFLFFFFAT